MVKKTIILLVAFIGVVPFYSAKAQITDSIKCDKYFRDLEKVEPLLTWWSTPPILKESNTPILQKLCDIITSNDSYKNFYAALILDTKGMPICSNIYPEITNDSLKNKIAKLLLQLEFEPAVGHQASVMSYYLLIFNSNRCESYKHKNKLHNRRWWQFWRR